MKKFLGISLLTLFAISLFGRVSNAAPFSFSVDQFYSDGNLTGNIVDEFNDGILDPWDIQEGTAIESNNVLTFTNPGDVENSIQNGLAVTYERSSVELESSVADTYGDFILQSAWLPVMPDLGLGYGMTFHYPPSGADQVAIGITNLDTFALSLIGAPEGTGTGSYIYFIQISPEFGNGYGNMTFNSQMVPITAEDITGEIIFQLIFSDDSNSFSAEYSLDGGSTFYQPFNTFSISSLDGSMETFVELEAFSLTAAPVPEPATMILLGSVLVGLLCVRKKLIKK